MQEQDLQGMTLAELRRVNAQLCNDRLVEQEALRIECHAVQEEYHYISKAAETDYESNRDRLLSEWQTAREESEDEYKRLGAHIGAMMDERQFCDSLVDIERLRRQIDEAMDKRKSLRQRRRAFDESYRGMLLELKRAYVAGRKSRYEDHSERLREFRKARLEIAQRYALQHDAVRKVIAIRKAMERAKAE